MATIIDVAALATEHAAVCKGEVTILPAERACFSGDVERLGDIIDFQPYSRPDGAHAAAMTLVVLSCEHSVVRIHKCGVCGRERRFGGPAR